MMLTDPSKSIPSIPRETARAANAIFGRSNFHMLVGEHLEALLEGLHLERPPATGGEKPTLALITFFQFVEGLTDTQAAEAIRTRTDWKFALHLPLFPALFQESALCEFRQRILIDLPSQLEFQRLIDRLVKLFSSIRNSAQPLKSLEVVALVCSLIRLNRAQQAMHQALEVLAFQFPEWLRKATLPHWYGRYNRATPRLEVAMLLGEQRSLMEEIGADIHYLQNEVQQSGPRELNELQEIKLLNQIWAQQFQAPYLDHWPEKQTAHHCTVCPFKPGGRRS